MAVLGSIDPTAGTTVSAAQLPFAGDPGRAGVGRKCEYRLLGGDVRSCCIPEVQMSLGNGRLPPDTFRLVGPNIGKHLTA
jgi:hypothetical protein